MEARAGATCEIEWANIVPRQMRDERHKRSSQDYKVRGRAITHKHKGRDGTIRHAREQGTWDLGKGMC